MSQNSVLAIAQDSRGFMWFGTQNGLNRYDGRRFKVYRNKASDTNSLSDNHISVLLNDSRGTLWIGTINGLDRYDPGKDGFEHAGAGPQGKISGNVYTVYETRDGNIWAGTANALYEIVAGSNKGSGSPVYVKKILDRKNIFSLFEDHEGYMWVGTSDGLLKMELKSGNYRFVQFRHDNDVPSSISSNYVMAIAEDNRQNLWVGTIYAGLNLYDRNTGTFSHFMHKNGTAGILHNNIRRIFSDSSGKLWISTQEGLNILDPATQKIVSYQNDPQNKNSLSQNSIYDIFRDRSGVMWIGTYFGGINIIYPHQTGFTVYQYAGRGSGLSNDVVSAIKEDDRGNLWIGTEGGGLNYFNRQTGGFIHYPNKVGDLRSLSNNLVKDVLRDRAGRLWVSTHGADLNLFNPATGGFTHYLQRFRPGGTISGSEIVTVLEDSYGRLWTGSSAGLGILQKNGDRFDTYITKAPQEYGLHSINVKFLFEDKQKNLWIGTAKGLQVFWDKDKTMQVFLQDEKDSGSLKSDNINCISQDSRGNIWIGTYYGGLSMYDAARGRFTSYTQKNGLPDNNVLGILEDERGNLWISTGNGLSRFDPAKRDFKTYTYSDGLAGNEFNYNSFFRDSRGEMFFGGYKGLTAFYPGDIQTNNYVAPLVFISLKLFNQPDGMHTEDGLLEKDISLAEDIRIGYNQDDLFVIDFALLNYIKPDKNRYAYKLEGLDKDWTETGSPSITYTHLPPGDYTLLVKGANNDGIWSVTPAALRIKVLPPFWKTWWAYLIYGVLFAGILFFVTRFFFLKALLKKEDEMHQARLNFFTNISHEIRTHLALIIGPVERMLLGKGEEDSDSRQLKYIKKNSDSLLQLVNELMDFRKAESGNLQLHVVQANIVAFLQDIYASFQDLALSKNIATAFAAQPESILLYFDKEQLEKVVFNLLSNAFKFTPDGGRISVIIEERKSAVDIKVADNGKGIAPGNLEKLFLNYYQENDYGKQNTGYGIGMALSRSIVELHKGSIAVTSSVTKGGKDNNTCFTVTLPKGNDHFTEGQLSPSGGPWQHISHHLPAEETHPPADTEAIAGVNKYEDLTEADKKYMVLVVEDNAEVRSFMRESLKSYYEVIESADGFAGWECAVELIPDLIITDVMMPEMDGLALCGKLKSDERTSHIPVIMLTARSSTAGQVSGLEMGTDIYLTKPFSIQVLLLHVRNLLASRDKMRRKYGAAIALPPDTGEAAAEAAGTAEATFANPIDEAFLQKVVQIVEEHMDDPELGVELLCRKVAMSRTVLYKKLKAVTDMSVNDFVKSIRLKKAAALLRQKQYHVNEVAYMVGFGDRKYFSKEFKKQFSVTPSEYSGHRPEQAS